MGSTVPYLMLLAVLASSSFALPPPKEALDEANKTIDQEDKFVTPGKCIYCNVSFSATLHTSDCTEKDMEDISELCRGVVRESRAISASE